MGVLEYAGIGTGWPWLLFGEAVWQSQLPVPGHKHLLKLQKIYGMLSLVLLSRPFFLAHSLAGPLCFQQNDPEGSKGGELHVHGFSTYPHQFKSL